jgi:hypothetical protein
MTPELPKKRKTKQKNFLIHTLNKALRYNGNMLPQPDAPRGSSTQKNPRQKREVLQFFAIDARDFKTNFSVSYYKTF